MTATLPFSANIAGTFITYLLRESAKGTPLDRIVIGFVKQKGTILGLTLAGASGHLGLMTSLALWESSLGFWGTLGLRLGLLSAPAWVPAAGVISGLLLAGTAVHTAMSFVHHQHIREKLNVVSNYSKAIAQRSGHLDTAEAQQLRQICRGFKIKEAQIDTMISQEICHVKIDNFKQEERGEIAGLIFSVMMAHGYPQPMQVAQFRTICRQLELEEGFVDSLLQKAEEILNNQWLHVQGMVHLSRSILEEADASDEHFETFNALVDKLVTFDPRVVARAKRQRTLGIAVASAGIASHVAAQGLPSAVILATDILCRTVLAHDPQRLQAITTILATISRRMNSDDRAALANAAPKVLAVLRDAASSS